MNTKISPKLFHLSGINSSFDIYPDLPFEAYLNITRHKIAQSRIDLTPETAESIIEANSPFEFQPNLSTNPTRGILLIHGLFDSPFACRDLGHYFASKGFFVRSILLPGHGTVPGDLLDVHYNEWIKAVDYGVKMLSQTVDQVFLVGFSLGGLLSLHKALRDKTIRGIGLLAPALGLKNQVLFGNLIRLQRWISWAFTERQWYVKRSFQKDPFKYESFCCNAATQVYRLMEETQNMLSARKGLKLPIFLSVSAEDEVISSRACLHFFRTYADAHSRLRWYTRRSHAKQYANLPRKDARMSIHNSVFPEQKILDFSHACLLISPENPHYGVNGTYQDFLGYVHNEPPKGREIFLGSVSMNNLRTYAIQRLRYNPDFAEMVKEIERFFSSCLQD